MEHFFNDHLVLSSSPPSCQHMGGYVLDGKLDPLCFTRTKGWQRGDPKIGNEKKMILIKNIKNKLLQNIKSIDYRILSVITYTYLQKDHISLLY